MLLRIIIFLFKIYNYINVLIYILFLHLWLLYLYCPMWRQLNGIRFNRPPLASHHVIAKPQLCLQSQRDRVRLLHGCFQT